jgi:hypothetical protein
VCKEKGRESKACKANASRNTAVAAKIKTKRLRKDFIWPISGSAHSEDRIKRAQR